MYLSHQFGSSLLMIDSRLHKQLMIQNTLPLDIIEHHRTELFSARSEFSLRLSRADNIHRLLHCKSWLHVLQVPRLVHGAIHVKAAFFTLEVGSFFNVRRGQIGVSIKSSCRLVTMINRIFIAALIRILHSR